MATRCHQRGLCWNDKYWRTFFHTISVLWKASFSHHYQKRKTLTSTCCVNWWCSGESVPTGTCLSKVPGGEKKKTFKWKRNLTGTIRPQIRHCLCSALGKKKKKTWNAHTKNIHKTIFCLFLYQKFIYQTKEMDSWNNSSIKGPWDCSTVH